MKNKFFLLLIASMLFTGYISYSQSSTTPVANPEKIAEFKGGMNGWMNFLVKNINREWYYKKNAPSGEYKVVGEFMVDSTGAVSDIKIITDPGYGSADEYIRILKLSSKKWVPAFDKGKNVAYIHKQSLTLSN